MCVDFDSLVAKNKEKKNVCNSCLYLFCKDILVHECLRKCSSAQTNQTCRTKNSMYMITIINKPCMKSVKFTDFLSPLTQLRDKVASFSSSLCRNVTLVSYGLPPKWAATPPSVCLRGRAPPSTPSEVLRATLWVFSSAPRLTSRCRCEERLPQTALTRLLCRLLVSRQSGQEPHQAPRCGCRSNTRARDHTNPGFMDDLKHLGQPFVPFVCRHLRETEQVIINSGFINAIKFGLDSESEKNNVHTHQEKKTLHKYLIWYPFRSLTMSSRQIALPSWM